MKSRFRMKAANTSCFFPPSQSLGLYIFRWLCVFWFQYLCLCFVSEWWEKIWNQFPANEIYTQSEYLLVFQTLYLPNSQLRDVSLFISKICYRISCEDAIDRNECSAASSIILFISQKWCASYYFCELLTWISTRRHHVSQSGHISFK